MRNSKFLWMAYAVVGLMATASLVVAGDYENTFQGGAAADLLTKTKAPGAERELASKSKLSLKMTCRLGSGLIIDRGHPQFQDCLERTAKRVEDENSPIPINM